MVSSVEKDPGLGIDWGYFVEAEPFRQYLLSVTDQKEVRAHWASVVRFRSVKIKIYF